jgi:hypothetical protein
VSSPSLILSSEQWFPSAPWQTVQSKKSTTQSYTNLFEKLQDDIFYHLISEQRNYMQIKLHTSPRIAHALAAEQHSDSISAMFFALNIIMTTCCADANRHSTSQLSLKVWKHVIIFITDAMSLTRSSEGDWPIGWELCGITTWVVAWWII